MTPYTVFIREGAMTSMPKSHAQKRLIMNFIQDLAHDPFHIGHYIDHDNLGRSNEVKIIGRFAVTYWADHASREVKVLNIQPAD